MDSKFKFYVITVLGLIVCTAPVIIATLNYFPIWKSRSSSAFLSGFTVLLLLICIYPLIRFLKKMFASPSVYMCWLAIFILFALIKEIADEMTVISFVGFISNAIGALIFKIAKRIGDKNERVRKP